MFPLYKIVCKLHITHSMKFQILFMVNEPIHNLGIIYNIPLSHIPIPDVPTPQNWQILFKGIIDFHISLPCCSLPKMYLSPFLV